MAAHLPTGCLLRHCICCLNCCTGAFSHYVYMEPLHLLPPAPCSGPYSCAAHMTLQSARLLASHDWWLTGEPALVAGALSMSASALATTSEGGSSMPAMCLTRAKFTDWQGLCSLCLAVFHCRSTVPAARAARV